MPETTPELTKYLKGFPDLEGKPATLEYLPTPRSKKWRRGFYIKSYGQVAYNSAMNALRENNWASFRFTGGML